MAAQECLGRMTRRKGFGAGSIGSFLMGDPFETANKTFHHDIGDYENHGPVHKIVLAFYACQVQGIYRSGRSPLQVIFNGGGIMRIVDPDAFLHGMVQVD